MSFIRGAEASPDPVESSQESRDGMCGGLESRSLESRNLKHPQLKVNLARVINSIEMPLITHGLSQ